MLEAKENFLFYTVHASIIESHCPKMFWHPKQ